MLDNVIYFNIVFLTSMNKVYVIVKLHRYV